MSTITNEPGKVVLDEYYGPPQASGYTPKGDSSSPQNTQQEIESYPFYIKWSIKIGTVILGLLTMLMGILALLDLFDFTIGCLFSGIILM